MQFYPHNIPLTTIGNAVSASLALTGSLINNFAAIPVITVDTASLALNIQGAPGTPGTSVAVTGPKGPTGARGVTGFRGNSIFLLSSSWSGSACGEPPVSCTGPFNLYDLRGEVFQGDCGNLSTYGIYYTNYGTSLETIYDSSADGSLLYTDNSCITVAQNVIRHNGGRIFSTDSTGVISSWGCLA